MLRGEYQEAVCEIARISHVTAPGRVIMRILGLPANCLFSATPAWSDALLEPSMTPRRIMWMAVQSAAGGRPNLRLCAFSPRYEEPADSLRYGIHRILHCAALVIQAPVLAHAVAGGGAFSPQPRDVLTVVIYIARCGVAVPTQITRNG
jgi:hypothetical protein